MTQTAENMTRVSGYVSKRERAALEELAAEQNTSLNYLLRLAIRQFLGIDKPSREVERV